MSESNYCPCGSDFDDKVGIFWECPNCGYQCTFREPPANTQEAKTALRGHHNNATAEE